MNHNMSVIIFNPTNNKPVDISFGPNSLDIAERIVSAWETMPAKHVAYLTYREYDESWFGTYRDYQTETKTYQPRHKKEN